MAKRGEKLVLGAKEREAKRIMQPAGTRSYMRRVLADKFPEIVNGFVEAAKTGSVPHVKLATELLKPLRKGTTRRKSSAQRVLEELQREGAARRRAAEAAKGTEQSPQ